MQNSRVIFEDDNQKIIVHFQLDDNEGLRYKIETDPLITDPKQNVGLIGYFCNLFMDAVAHNGQEQPDNNE